MEELTVAQLAKDMRYEGFLLVRSAEQRVDKKGAYYLDVTLCDRTGEINCKVWNWSGQETPPPSGSVIKVRGTVQEFNGRLQLRIELWRMAKPEDGVDMQRLIPCAPEPPETMRGEIDRVIDSFESENLKKITREMLRLAGEELDFYPAAQRMHHAERSGLLHHTTSMLATAEKIVEAYPFLHRDLLLAGVIIHDLAKIDEMQSDSLGNVADYTRDGLLIGHLVRGVSRLDEAARSTGVTGETLALLEHMLISHHGEPEFGSPRRPMFPEAEALHWIDTFDAKMNEMFTIQERTPEGAFSERIKYLDDRRLYHPRYSDDAE